MRASLLLFAAALLLPVSVASADNDRQPADRETLPWQQKPPRPQPQRDEDCTPINGRFGYYGNPWCDTGSTRPADMEYRDRQRQRAQ